MARYYIESPHTKEECLKAMDEVLQQGAGVLAKYDWGCMAGQHTGWAVVDASNESAALNMVPSIIRNKAHVVKVEKLTPEQIVSFHKERAA